MSENALVGCLECLLGSGKSSAKQVWINEKRNIWLLGKLNHEEDLKI